MSWTHTRRQLSMKKIFIIVALVLAVVVIGSGIAGIAIGQAKSHNLSSRLATEAVSLRTFDTNAPADAVVTNAAEAQLAADTLDKHRKSIAPTYAALLNGQKFDPTNPKAVSYTHLRAHETDSYLVCRLLLEKKKK